MVPKGLRHIADAELRWARVAARGFLGRAVALAVAAGLSLIAVMILCLAVFLELSSEHGPVVAGMVVAGALALLALLVLLVGFVIYNRRAMIVADAEARVARARASAEMREMALLTGALGPGQSKLGSKAALIALAVGLIVGLRR